MNWVYKWLLYCHDGCIPCSGPLCTCTAHHDRPWSDLRTACHGAPWWTGCAPYQAVCLTTSGGCAPYQAVCLTTSGGCAPCQAVCLTTSGGCAPYQAVCLTASACTPEEAHPVRSSLERALSHDTPSDVLGCIPGGSPGGTTVYSNSRSGRGIGIASWQASGLCHAYFIACNPLLKSRDGKPQCVCCGKLPPWRFPGSCTALLGGALLSSGEALRPVAAVML